MRIFWPFVILVLLALTACNRIGFAYKHLDTLTPWYVDDYLDLDSTQRRWLDTAISQHLQWHCREELPRYIEWMEHMKPLAQASSVSTDVILEQITTARRAVDAIALEITPTAITLLQGLNDQQVAHLNNKLHEDLEELRKKHVSPSRGEQIHERSERMKDRMTFWLGSLSEQQQARILQWAVQLGDHNKVWLDNRTHWQKELHMALTERTSADFPSRLTALLQNRERFWTATYQREFSRIQTLTAQLVAELLTMRSPLQRQHTIDRLTELQSDLQPYRCDDKNKSF
ncbi:hypothetical protein IQ22_03664 [Pseudomonas duriflava]|uniref:Lipoprotein n=2 Tax=Pseudomonas duriflava TaxID=459528 RepID=A0A562Q2S4_9PSED|nr:hypothetical protein IQ22_03664 [Pseudomonas duriflava]